MERRGDRIADRYYGASGSLRQMAHRARVHWVCAKTRGPRVLDVGCSQGITSILLGREGYEVVGIDVAPELIAQAQEALAREAEAVQHRVRFVADDVLSGELDLGRFDTVIAGEVFEHLTQPRRLVERCAQLLKPEGVLVASVPFGIDLDDDHKEPYYLSTLAELLASRFHLSEVEAVDRWLCATATLAVGEHAKPGPPADRDGWLALSEALTKRVEQRLYERIDRLQSRATRLQEELANARRAGASGSSGESADRTIHRLEEAAASLRQELASRESALESLRERVAACDRQVAETERERSGQQDRMAGLVADSEQNETLVRALRSQNRELRRGLTDARQELSDVKTRLRKVECSTSYRVGHALVQGLKRPWKLPFAVARVLGLLARGALRKLPWLRMRAAIPAAKARSATEAAAATRVAPVLVREPRAAAPVRPALRIAVLGSERLRRALSYECDAVQVRRGAFERDLRAARPAFLLIECGQPELPVPGYGFPTFTTAAEAREGVPQVLSCCRRLGIPTVLWETRETPPANTATVARNVDCVASVSQTHLDAFRRSLPHARTLLLEPAVQPRLHNPVRESGEAPYQMGTLVPPYGIGADEAAERMNMMLRHARSTDLIAWRHDQKEGKALRQDPRETPTRLSHLLGAEITAAQECEVYKMHEVYLHLGEWSPGQDLPTPQLLEVLASGVPVVSVPNRWVRERVGEQIVRFVRDPLEVQIATKTLLGNPKLRDRMIVLGLREVLTNYTYGRRVEQLCEAMDIPAETAKPMISVMTATNRASDLQNIFRNYTQQHYECKELILVLNTSETTVAEAMQLANAAGIPDPKVIYVDEQLRLADCLNAAVGLVAGQYVAKMDGDDFYAPHYLSDLMLAFSYVDADLVGKRNYFSYLEDSGCMTMRFPGSAYQYVRTVAGATFLFRRGLLDQVRFDNRLEHGTDSRFLQDCRAIGAKVFSTDPYNFAAVRRADKTVHTFQMPDDEYLRASRVEYYGSSFEHVIV